MNDWIHPSLLESNLAAKLVNATVSNGKLVPIRRPVYLSDNTPEAYGHYGTKDRSVVKYNGRYYWSNNNASAAPYYGGNPENFLGVPYPTYGTGGNVQVDFTFALSIEGAIHLTGDYKYCVTFVTENEWEGAPGSLTEYEVGATIENKNPKITVTWSDERIAYAKIYRTADHGADFYEVGQIHKTEQGGQTYFDVFVDEMPDEEAVLQNPLTSQENYPPPDGGKYLCENGGVFFLAKDSLLYFSALGSPHAWPTAQFITFDDVITGITPEFQGVLVFTRNNVYRVVGADAPETVQKLYIPGNHGCISWRSIAALNNAPVWLSNDGICLWDGNSITVPSYRVIKTSGLQESVRWAVTANDSYYLFTKNGTIVYDIRNGGIFYKLDFSFEYAWYDVSSAIFYLYNPNGTYRYDYGTNLELTYISPNIGGAESTLKIYREVYIVCANTTEFLASIDGIPLWDDPVVIQGGRQRIKLPLHAVGHWLSLNISSKDSISEVQVLYD